MKKRRDCYIDPMWGVLFALGIVVGIILCLMFAPAAQAVDVEQTATVPAEVHVAVLPSEAVRESVQKIKEPVPVDEPAEPKEPELNSLGWFTITAYCACDKCCGKAPGHPDYGVTATGTRATEGRTIAVDPGVIELGSTVYFEGVDALVRGYVAEDTGGAIKGNRIDVFFDSHDAALEWGVRELEVFQLCS